MKKEKHSTLFLLPFAGGLLILLNIFITAFIGTPAMISNYSPSSVEAVADKSVPTLWGRIAFGVGNYAEGNLPVFGIVLAAVIIYFSLILYFRPRNVTTLSIVIITFSAIALLYGGGFFVGSILAFVGGALAFQAPLEFGDSLIGKLLSSLWASSKVFKKFAGKASVKDAAMVILFVNLLSGIGNAIYTFNANGLVENLSTSNAFEILLNGKLSFDLAIVPTPITLMGFGMVKWIILSLLIFLVGVKFFKGESNLASIATVTGFAYAPISLQLFTPFIFTSTPHLMIWPMAVFILTNLWMIIVLVAGIRNILNVSSTKSLALVAFCGAIYTLINYVVFMPMSIAYVPKFQIQPPEVMLFILSIFIIVPPFFIASKE